MSTAQRRRAVTRRYSGQPKRIADQDFHLWPNLAFKCEACGLPVDRMTYPRHPTCEASAGGPASTPNPTPKEIR